MANQTAAEIKILLLKRMQEYAYYLALQAILTAEIEIRRYIEKNYPRVGMKLESVRVEQERDRVQNEARLILDELDGIIELWMKAARNE